MELCLKFLDVVETLDVVVEHEHACVELWQIIYGRMVANMRLVGMLVLICIKCK